MAAVCGGAAVLIPFSRSLLAFGLYPGDVAAAGWRLGSRAVGFAVELGGTDPRVSLGIRCVLPDVVCWACAAGAELVTKGGRVVGFGGAAGEGAVGGPGLGCLLGDSGVLGVSLRVRVACWDFEAVAGFGASTD